MLQSDIARVDVQYFITILSLLLSCNSGVIFLTVCARLNLFQGNLSISVSDIISYYLVFFIISCISTARSNFSKSAFAMVGSDVY